MTQLRYEVRTYISDQGDEIEVSQIPLLFEEGCAAVGDARVRLRAKQMNDDTVSAGVFFPWLMAFADELHITFHGFEEAVRGYCNWKKIESYLSCIVSFLSDRGLRGRFSELLCADAGLKKFVAHLELPLGLQLEVGVYVQVLACLVASVWWSRAEL